MILPIIIYVQFHEIMDNRPFVKIICLIPNRIPFATNNICTEYWDDWIFIFNIRFFAFSILLENILIKISLNKFEQKLKLYTINRFDFYTKYCTLSWLLKSILQIHEYINFKKKKLLRQIRCSLNNDRNGYTDAARSYCIFGMHMHRAFSIDTITVSHILYPHR